jgi:hypothetical protein
MEWYIYKASSRFAAQICGRSRYKRYRAIGSSDTGTPNMSRSHACFHDMPCVKSILESAGSKIPILRILISYSEDCRFVKRKKSSRTNLV